LETEDVGSTSQLLDLPALPPPPQASSQSRPLLARPESQTLESLSPNQTKKKRGGRGRMNPPRKRNGQFLKTGEPIDPTSRVTQTKSTITTKDSSTSEETLTPYNQPSHSSSSSSAFSLGPEDSSMMTFRPPEYENLPVDATHSGPYDVPDFSTVKKSKFQSPTTYTSSSSSSIHISSEQLATEIYSLCIQCSPSLPSNSIEIHVRMNIFNKYYKQEVIALIESLLASSSSAPHSYKTLDSIVVACLRLLGF
jgi:hypothetical protein